MSGKMKAGYESAVCADCYSKLFRIEERRGLTIICPKCGCKYHRKGMGYAIARGDSEVKTGGKEDSKG